MVLGLRSGLVVLGCPAREGIVLSAYSVKRAYYPLIRSPDPHTKAAEDLKNIKVKT